MLAEKFLLLLETLRSNNHDDGAPRVISTSPHVAVNLEQAKPDQDESEQPRRNIRSVIG